MKMDLSGKKVLMLIAPEHFRDEEFKNPKQILESNGAEVTVASRGVEKAEGMLGAEATVDYDISEIKVDPYHAIIFVGGSGAEVYMDDEDVHELAKLSYEKGKLMGAICIAPSILANAGLLEGKKVTAWKSEIKDLKFKGADYTGNDVEVDGRIITGKGPEVADKFGEKVAEALSEGLN